MRRALLLVFLAGERRGARRLAAAAGAAGSGELLAVRAERRASGDDGARSVLHAYLALPRQPGALVLLGALSLCSHLFQLSPFPRVPFPLVHLSFPALTIRVLHWFLPPVPRQLFHWAQSSTEQHDCSEFSNNTLNCAARVSATVVPHFKFPKSELLIMYNLHDNIVLLAGASVPATRHH